MAPPKQPQPPFSKDERVLCFHMEMLYEAKVLDVMPNDSGDGFQYKIHYKGWKSSWDDWVPQDRVRKFTEENKELATQLAQQYKALHSGNKNSAKTGTTKKGGAAGGGRGGAGAGSADLSSARGSEERTAGGGGGGGGGGAATQSGRGGQRRVRDFDLETVSDCHPLFTSMNLVSRGGLSLWMMMGFFQSFKCTLRLLFISAGLPTEMCNKCFSTRHKLSIYPCSFSCAVLWRVGEQETNGQYEREAGDCAVWCGQRGLQGKPR